MHGEPESRSYAAPPARADATFAKITWRLIPFLGVLWILAWIDRVNIGFAKLQMLDDLKFSQTVYGFGAGVLFCRLFSVRGSLEPIAGPHRRAKDDRPHNHRVGRHLHPADVRADAAAVLRRQVPAGRLRGRVLSGHHLLLERVVSRRRAGRGLSACSCRPRRSRACSAVHSLAR